MKREASGVKRFFPIRAVLIISLVVCALPAWSETRVEDSHDHGAVHQHSASGMTVSPIGQTPEEELAYTLFMHHSSGLAVLLVGVLVFTDRLTGQRFERIRLGMGLVWLIFGIHIFIRSDPEGWPVGPAGFLESFSMPTASEWMQHKALSLIPLSLGVFYLVHCGRQVGQTGAPRPSRLAYGNYVLAALGLLGAVGLLIHQHQDHPGMDLVNFQHRLMAVSSLFIVASAVLESQEWLGWRVKPYLLPSGLMIIGLQLALYVE